MREGAFVSFFFSWLVSAIAYVLILLDVALLIVRVFMLSLVFDVDELYFVKLFL